MQTAVEWLVEQMIYQMATRIENTTIGCELFEQAKEMEKQQIIDAAERWKGTDFAEKYYAETYGSKGSDDHICTYEKCPQCLKNTSPQTETLEESAERLFPKEKYPTSFETLRKAFISNAKWKAKTEISDEEIEKWVASTPYYGHCTPEYKEGLEEGAKWYREQLKQRQ